MHTRQAFIDNFADLPELADFANTAHWLSLRGWSEGAGGNMSVRIDRKITLLRDIPSDDYIQLPVHVPFLADTLIYLTGSGTRTRETALNPTQDVGLYYIAKDGQSYCWLAGNSSPTSELPAHCAIHNALAEHRPDDKAIMHTHPANLISLCHVPELANSKAVSDKILRLQSEARLHLPEGIGYVPHQIPGSLELGLASAKLVNVHRLVLWHMHGCLATGTSLAHAFDYMEVFEKCARMYWTLRAAGIDPVGMKEEDIVKTLTEFGRLDRYT
ncbi:MAG: rhamnulose-1-phosphate aldolase [Robiginitomaculum sp.]|nr:MAG: rhamnulose-1-phosphate aldolase [Robiginitomaculum sp.]